MRFWFRELAGWLLVGLGLYAFVLVYDLALARRLIEVLPVMIFGIFIFRGGIHLLKIAVAARVCRDAGDRLYPAAPPAPKPPARNRHSVKRPASPTDGTIPRASGRGRATA
jgi:hypothetical protein